MERKIMKARGETLANSRGRTILVGDLHGCVDEARSLLRKLSVTALDTVIWLGDYVDRGPHSAACCDLVREREQVQGSCAGILGNHEEQHLRYHDESVRSGRAPSMSPRHRTTHDQLKPEHYSWFRGLPHYLRLPEHRAVAVHAGLFPGRAIEDQDPYHLLHAQMLRPFIVDERGTRTTNERSRWPSKVPEHEAAEWRFWTHHWDGPEFVVFGHSVLDRPLITDRVAGIDGGACFGMKLHALVLQTREVVSVDSSINVDRKVRGDQTHPIRTFQVHGDARTFS